MADLSEKLPRAEGYAEMHQRLTGVLAPAALPEEGSDERVAYLDGLLAALDVTRSAIAEERSRSWRRHARSCA